MIVYIFLLIIFIGFLFRFWGIWHFEHTDEYNEVFEALKIDSGRINLDRWNKKVLVYILAFEYAVYYCIGWISGVFNNVSDFAQKIAVNMKPLFLIGRFTSVLFGTIIILITYKLAEKLFDKKVAIISSLFLCVNFACIKYSHLVTVDTTMSFFVVLSLFYSMQIINKGSNKISFLSGLFGGIAIVAKIPAIFIIVSIITANLIYFFKNNKNIKENKCVFLSIAGLLSGIIIGSPGILISPIRYIKYLYNLIGAYDGTKDIVPYFSGNNGFLFYAKILAYNMGWPLFIFCLLSLSLMFNRKYKFGILMLLSFVLPYYIFMASSDWFLADRYMLPIYPMLSIMAALYLVYIIEFFKLKKHTTILCIILIIFPLIKVIPFEVSLTNKNTRYEAKDWIEKNIPKGSKILIDAGKTINTQSAPISPNKANIKKMIHDIENLGNHETLDDSRIADSRSSIYFKLLLNALPEVTYDLTSTVRGENVKSYSYYINNGFDYVVTSDSVTFMSKTKVWREKFPKQAKFYDNLDKKRPIKIFTSNRFRQGPTIKIYRF